MALINPYRGLDGTPVQLAKGDLVAGLAGMTAQNVAVGTDGQVLAASSGAAPGVGWVTPAFEYYPLGKRFGYVAASLDPTSATQPGQFTGWRVSMFLPAYKQITAIAWPILTAGTVGAGGLNAFSVWSDDGQTMLGSTATDDTLWNSAGAVHSKALQSTVAATGADRFLWLRANVNGYSSAPYFCCAITAGADGTGQSINGGAGKKRVAYFNGASSWPSTFNPDTEGTITNYLPLAFFVG